MSAHLEIIEPGLATTIQDLGRRGLQRFGISASGVMDPIALATANALVGNATDTAALEITLAGPVLTSVGADIRVALAGADFSISIDGRPVTSHESHDLMAGQRLAIGTARDGARSVLAVSGGFAIAPMLGSLSTHSRSQLGGLNGGPLRKSDRLPLAVPRLPASPHLMVSPAHRRRAQGPVRVLLGPQDDAFGAEGLATFFGSEYAVTALSDRMGCRLEGPRIQHAGAVGIVSDGTVFGSIQIPGNGQPIILLADRQTTGGYPKIATVISADLPRLAQLRPGEHLRFQAIEEDDAVKLARAVRQQIDRIGDALIEVHGGGLTSEHLLASNLISGVISALEWIQADAATCGPPAT
ncbi:biotin-dependent carboxyltransferase family protein [Bradyrhizobium manausense]|uniref:5-oxoprolinase subunit C family protein n=1 Tax=Bradyrhizobium TaxID=374 RepID=UPI001BAC9C2E|nr:MULTISPECIES: biotin-dependent carboxyltransferase family protein [Bradyrhizobium]MBR0827728.1 biotin-dependent carboxyltransferase family protein [Bradyrhizobium manausense]UVO26202.1 biotin-dependent carboxyltransferase family protein [Bradyrhizobium arachidis]